MIKRMAVAAMCMSTLQHAPHASAQYEYLDDRYMVCEGAYFTTFRFLCEAYIPFAGPTNTGWQSSTNVRLSIVQPAAWNMRWAECRLGMQTGEAPLVQMWAYFGLSTTQTVSNYLFCQMV